MVKFEHTMVIYTQTKKQKVIFIVLAHIVEAQSISKPSQLHFQN
jgi:hypothetical protein